MRGMRKRKAIKEKNCVDMISPTSFYSSQGDKVKLNWFCYELALSIYDSMKDELAHRLRRKKISDEVLAEFSIHYAISHAWTQMLSICEVCPNRCISEKDIFCTLFDEKHLFE